MRANYYLNRWYLDIVIAPALVGGKDTSSLIDGQSLISRDELNKLGVFKLEKCEVLEDSYVRLNTRWLANKFF
jgi:2,5-diamino-6-(ribosylamino)-4(3H)-pyrimidinone 5'-phosphate reductase